MLKPIEQQLRNYPHTYITDIELDTLLNATPNSRHSKVKRMLAQSQLIRIRRGLYDLTNLQNQKKIHAFSLAQQIYAPSYISLESALSYHQLIPEAVYTVTNVCTKRAKTFHTPLGAFSYLHLPTENFYLGVERIIQDTHSFLIAKPWKAICDYIFCYKKDWRSTEPLKNNLRIHIDELPILSDEEVELLDDYYRHSRIHQFLLGIKKMSVEIIQQKLLSYQCQTLLDQENALKEIAQEIALLALSRSGFFRIAAFQGGTCLRILYGLERFSEDLDFALEEPDKNFNWNNHLNNMREEFEAYGYTLELSERSTLEKNIKSVFLKADSQGGMLVLRDIRTNKAKIKIKLEIDINPPEGSEYELKYLDFPVPYSVKTQNLPSLFASKCHALLCRDYVKGRDWYDFIWYISRKVKINFSLLNHAIRQAGPWSGKNIDLTPDWLLNALTTKILSIDWIATQQDIARFLRPRELPTLDLWSTDFFLTRVEKLSGYL